MFSFPEMFDFADRDQSTSRSSDVPQFTQGVTQASILTAFSSILLLSTLLLPPRHPSLLEPVMSASGVQLERESQRSYLSDMSTWRSALLLKCGKEWFLGGNIAVLLLRIGTLSSW